MTNSRASWQQDPIVAAGLAAATMVMVLWPALGRAQSDVQVEFRATIERKVDARPSQAQVATEDASALRSKGYAEIGSIQASLPAKKVDSQKAEQLETAILRKAADNGGDLVILSKRGALEEIEIPDEKKTKCLQSETVSVYAGQDCVKSCFTDSAGHTNCINASCSPKYRDVEQCRVYGETTESVGTHRGMGLVSEGTVWRDPNRVTPTLGESMRSLFPVLGKRVQSDEFKAWLEKLGEPPEIDRFDDCYFYVFKQHGVDLRFDKTDVVKVVFFYSKGADGHAQYVGDLPFGLSFQMTRREIESILGPPESSGGSGAGDAWASYETKGIGINYDRKNPRDLKARIRDISISTRE